MDSNQTKGAKTASGNNKKKQRQASILEALKDIGGASASSMKRDVFEGAGFDIRNQLFGGGMMPPMPPRSGEIYAGESVEMNDIISGRHDEEVRLKKQLFQERYLRREEEELRVTKGNELKLQLKAIMEEVVAISQTTENLSEEIQIAANQAPVNPGVYHLVFFEKLLIFLRSYRQKVEEASTWLHSSNKRAQKKNYWTKYKKHGSSFLLSPDHYLTRSAG